MQPANFIHYYHDPLTELKLILCRDSTISYPLHTHVTTFTVGLVLSGSVLLTVGGASHLHEKGQSFLLPPHTPHKIDAQAPYSLLSLCIHRATLTKHSPEELQDDLQRLLDTASEPDTLPLQLLACLPPSSRGLFQPLPPSIAAAAKQLECFPETTLQVGEIARSAYMSKYHFIRSFQHATGLTPHQFQMQNRIRKAQRILSGSSSLAEVALAAGFYDQSHFTRNFKRLVGLTPASYRASIIELPLLK